MENVPSARRKSRWLRGHPTLMLSGIGARRPISVRSAEKKSVRICPMKYNRPQATASWGTMAKDWEKGIDYDRLPKARVKRAQEAIRHAGLGAVLAFNFDNIRYIPGTHIGEWARDKFMRYAICPVVGEPLLWDPAPPAKRLSSPWIADNVAAPISTMQGGLPPQLNIQGDFARQIKKV